MPLLDVQINDLCWGKRCYIINGSYNNRYATAENDWEEDEIHESGRSFVEVRIIYAETVPPMYEGE